MRRRLWAGGARIGAALLGVLLAAGGHPGGTARADVAPSVMIVPGLSIGPVRLGMSAKDVTSVLGDPVPGDGGQIRFPRVAVTVTLEDGAVVRVSTTNPHFRTSRGVGVGISLDDSARLIDDPNQAVAVDGSDTTISYPFQGIGLVFHGERAVEVFIVQAVARNPSLPPPSPEAIPALPPSDDLAQQTPPSDTAVQSDTAAQSDTAPSAEPQTPLQAAPSAQTMPSPEGVLVVRDLAEAIDAGPGILRITGKVAETGTHAVGVTVSVRIFRARGPADGETGALTSQMRLEGAGEAPFSLDVSVAPSVVIRYKVEALVFRAGTTSRLVLAERTISREAYTDLARARVQVSVALGGPSNIAPRVQVLVSIAGTGPIPPDWVREVQVQIPFTGGSSSVTLTPGQVQTIFIPSVAQVGTPQVQGVVFNAS